MKHEINTELIIGKYLACNDPIKYYGKVIGYLSSGMYLICGNSGINTIIDIKDVKRFGVFDDMDKLNKAIEQFKV